MASIKAPPGLGPPGRKLWKAITGEFDLGEHELLILVQACHTADTCAELQTWVAREHPVLEGADGPRMHPACREVRQQRIVLARLLTCLRIPLDEDEGRTQYRGPRGVYGIQSS